MNNYDFLNQLRELDIHVSVVGGKLRINAPKGAVTPEIQNELRARKEEILSLLSEIDPIAIETQEEPAYLSLAQEHLWQLHRLIPDTAAYNMYAVFRLSGELDLQAFESAVYAVVERHKMLRACFPNTTHDAPEICIAPASTILLQRETLTAATNTQDAIQPMLEEALRFPFDLSSGPLFRPILVQVHPSEHVFILVMHHIISDGQSFDILYKDLSRAYQAAWTGGSVDWQALPLQYSDYANWQRKWLNSNASTSDRIFWQNHLSGNIPPLEIPFDHPHPVQTVPDGSSIKIGFRPGLSSALTDFCQREGVTVFTAALAAMNILLHRHSGQQDLLVCTPAAGRDRVEFNSLVGYFNNTLVLRTNLTGVRTFRELVHQTQALVTKALAHQMFPFKEVAGFPNLVRTPLSRAMLLVQDASRVELQLPGIEIEPLPVFNDAVQYDIALELTVKADQLEGRFMYRKVLFEPETVLKLAAEFTAIMEEMVATPDSAIRKETALKTVHPPRRREMTLAPYTAPRDDLERRLVEIWQEILDVERVGIYDEFFALGGHSLLALRLFTRIEQETETNLPLSSLFETTTIAHLAQLIRGETSDSAWDCLVPIQPLGSKPPLFFVHGIGGGVLGYRDLTNALGDDQPVLGLQAVGQDGLVPYDLTIESMAVRYIEVMRTVQPQGPYRLGGYCLGGVVAFEMACQLERMGEQVSLMAVFEGGMPDTMEPNIPIMHRVRTFYSTIPAWVQDYKKLTRGQIFKRFSSTFFKFWVKLRGDPNIQRRLRVEETLDMDINSLPKTNIELTELHLKAVIEYVPKVYEGTLTLFRARNRGINEVLFSSLDPKMGWGPLAKGGVSVYLVDGYHRNMHLEPHVKSLAAELKKQLEALD